MFKLLRDKSIRTIANLHFSTKGEVTVDFNAMFQEGVVRLLEVLESEHIAEIYMSDPDYNVPERLLESFGDEPILFFFYLDKHGFHIVMKRASSENAPLFRIEPSLNYRKSKVRALNREASDILLALMGNGCRAIIKGSQDRTGFYVEPTCRPAGKLSGAMYEVRYTVGEGKDAYPTSDNCVREELIEFIENPNFHELNIRPL